MHERNPYRFGIDFVSLSQSFPPLKPYLIKTGKDNVSIDFKNNEAQRRLTEAILARDFNLKLSLPEGRLCPPVPNRLNYILWIQDLLKATFYSLSFEANVVQVTGVDIGTGASAIYPLLACSLESRWRIISTEIDAISFTYASFNVAQDNLTDRISVVKTSSSDYLFKPIFDNKELRFSFTMCNPPFYGSAEEVERSAEGKAMEPYAVCTGAEIEMITPGGESAFVRRMIDESLLLCEQCLWYTSMLGKLSSIVDVVESLRSYKIDNYAITELRQGQTRRWVIGWSYSDARLPDGIARDLPAAHHTLLPLPNCLTQSYASASPIDRLRTSLESVLRGIEGVTFSSAPHENSSRTENPEDYFTLRVEAMSNTWSRATRRRARQKEAELSTGPPAVENQKSSLIVLIRTAVYSQVRKQQSTALECIWVRGRDRALFESFWSHVSRKVGASLENSES